MKFTWNLEKKIILVTADIDQSSLQARRIIIFLEVIYLSSGKSHSFVSTKNVSFSFSSDEIKLTTGQLLLSQSNVEDNDGDNRTVQRAELEIDSDGKQRGTRTVGRLLSFKRSKGRNCINESIGGPHVNQPVFDELHHMLLCGFYY